MSRVPLFLLHQIKTSWRWRSLDFKYTTNIDVVYEFQDMHLRYIQRSLPVKDTLKCKQTNNKISEDFKSVQVQCSKMEHDFSWKRVYDRGDSMNWDFVGRRSLPVRDYVVSIKGGPKLWNHVSKVWRLLVWWNKTDEKLDVKISFLVVILPNMSSPNFW